MGLDAGAIKGVSEVAFWVSDLDAALAFYRDRLGLEVEDFSPGRHAFLKSGDLYVVLFNPQQPGTVLADEYLARTGGPRGDVYHVAFKVDADAIDAHAETLRSGGLQVKGPVEFVSGRRSYFFEDLNGHYLELTDR